MHLAQSQIVTSKMHATTYQPFTSLTGDVKRRVKDLSLGPLTRIVGEEGAYKSAIAIAVKLALTGEYDAVGKLPSELLTLAADQSLGIEVTLSGPSGDAEWRLPVDPDTGKAKRPDRPVFSGAIASLTEDERYCIVPTDAVRDLLKNAKGERKAREAFLRRFGGSIRELSTPDVLDEQEHEAWTKAVGDCKSRLTGGGEEHSADSLLAMLSESFRALASAKQKELKPLDLLLKEKQKTLTRLEMQDGLTPELLPEKERQLQLAKNFEEAQLDHAELAKVNEALRAIQTEIDADVADEATRTTAHTTRLSAIDRGREEAEVERVKAFDAVLTATKKLAFDELNEQAYRRALDKGENKCPYCPTKFGESSSLLRDTHKAFGDRLVKSTFALESAKTALAVAEANKKERDVERADCVQAFQQETWKRTTTQDDLRRRLVEASSRQKTLTTKLVAAPKVAPKLTVATLTKEVQDLKSFVEAKSALSKDGGRLRKLQKEQDLYKKLGETAIELQKTVMLRVSKRASEEVTQGMLGGRRAMLDPESCEWVVVGQDGEAHTWGAMCGTERTSLRLALVAAWTRGSPLRVPIFDDEDMVGLSRKGLRDFYDVCEALQVRGDFTQVIIVSNRPDETPSSSNWLTILCEPRATIDLPTSTPVAPVALPTTRPVVMSMQREAGHETYRPEAPVLDSEV